MHRTALTYLIIFTAVNFAFVTPSGLLQHKDSSPSIIDWAETEPLSWHDFKGNVISGRGISALTASAIEYSYECSGQHIDLSIKAIFIPEESWVKEDAKTEYILSHEQLHFDITEVYARKMRKELVRKVIRCSDARKIEPIAQQIIKEWKFQQKQYDIETRHSIKKDVQQLWNEKVEYELNASADYTSENWKLTH